MYLKMYMKINVFSAVQIYDLVVSKYSHSDPLYCLGIYRINGFIQFHAGLKRRELF